MPRTGATGREWRLLARPRGTPRESDFALVDVELPRLRAGEVMVENEWLSVDPYMRARMDDVPSYAAPYALDSAMEGGAVGRVAASTVATHSVGDLVLHRLGWRDLSVGPAELFQVLGATPFPASFHLGVLGMPGLTAYAGLRAVARLRPGETVFVSGAAGAVGSTAGQLARAWGAEVIGSAGSPSKTAWLTRELGFDAAIDYTASGLAVALRHAAPDGIDVYFDNVGGDHLEAAIGALKVHGRAVLCGMISGYNSTSPSPAPTNLYQVIAKRLRLEGLLVRDHSGLQAEFLRHMTALLSRGAVIPAETVVDGLEHAVSALLRMFAGENTGKMIVRL